MDRDTSRIKAYNEIEDGTLISSKLGLIRPDFRSSYNGKETLCLWGEEHVVF